MEKVRQRILKPRTYSILCPGVVGESPDDISWIAADVDTRLCVHRVHYYLLLSLLLKLFIKIIMATLPTTQYSNPIPNPILTMHATYKVQTLLQKIVLTWSVTYTIVVPANYWSLFQLCCHLFRA